MLGAICGATEGTGNIDRPGQYGDRIGANIVVKNLTKSAGRGGGRGHIDLNILNGG
jgi:hypothetical protein